MIYTGSDNNGDYVYVVGDLYGEGSLIDAADFDLERGRENDGDDIIDVGDNNTVSDYVGVYSQGGNDKVIGGIGHAGAGLEYLYGGDGDDKIWAHNPGQFEDDGSNYLFGNNGNDIIYGSQGADDIYGDWDPSAYDAELYFGDTEGGNDILYTGEATGAA